MVEISLLQAPPLSRPIISRMLDRLLHALIKSKNAAADDVLLDALHLGSVREKQVALMGLLRRKTVRGLGGVIESFATLPENVQGEVLRNIKTFNHALRECGRSERAELRLAALKLIAIAHQGRLAYVLSENLHEADERYSRAAVEAMVALARWVATTSRAMLRGAGSPARNAEVSESSGAAGADFSTSDSATAAPDVNDSLYLEILAQRPEIEESIARAMDVHRGKHGQELLRAAPPAVRLAGK